MANKSKYESAREWYLSNFEKFENKLNGHSETFLHKLRLEGVEKLKGSDFPTQRDEEWKYTNVGSIMKENFVPAATTENPVVGSEEVNRYMFKDFDYYTAVFVNGIYNAEFSDLEGIPSGIVVDSLANVVKNKPEILEGKIDSVKSYENAFNYLNLAYAYDGLVVYVPAGKVLDKPVQVLYLSGSEKENVISQPRNIIIAEDNAQARVINNYRGIDGKVYFTNVVNEIFAGKNAIVDLYKVQNENYDSYHIDKTQIYQEKESVVSHYNFSFGGKIVRNDINAEMGDEFIETNYFGLYLANEKQHVDNHTFADHAKPNCVSNELYKGILDDKSRGVFNGKILVRQDAQKTNAYQSNKTILLSDDARIDTKPQLEIYADDVKCSHGATIGHLDDTAYFYIRSRGVPAELAKSMLIRAFANDVLEPVKIDALQEQLNHMIFDHLHRVEI